MQLDRAILRLARNDDLAPLLDLYRHLHTDDAPLPARPQVEKLWQSILADPHLRYVVAELDGRLVSSCTLAIVRNLTRGARPYGLIENVVTHSDYRRRGLGTAVLRYALQTAWDADCYKVMLLTGRKQPEVLRFYEQAGFRMDVKTGFVATPPTAVT